MKAHIFHSTHKVKSFCYWDGLFFVPRLLITYVGNSYANAPGPAFLQALRLPAILFFLYSTLTSISFQPYFCQPPSPSATPIPLPLSPVSPVWDVQMVDADAQQGVAGIRHPPGAPSSLSPWAVLTDSFCLQAMVSLPLTRGSESFIRAWTTGARTTGANSCL